MSEVEPSNLDRAVEELANGSTPDPTDWMGRYSPLACLWYVRQATVKAAQRWAEDLELGADDELDEDGLLQRVTLGIGKAAAVLTLCCTEMEMLAAPDDEQTPDGFPVGDDKEVAVG